MQELAAAAWVDDSRDADPAVPSATARGRGGDHARGGGATRVPVRAYYATRTVQKTHVAMGRTSCSGSWMPTWPRWSGWPELKRKRQELDRRHATPAGPAAPAQGRRRATAGVACRRRRDRGVMPDHPRRTRHSHVRAAAAAGGIAHRPRGRLGQVADGQPIAANVSQAARFSSRWVRSGVRSPARRAIVQPFRLGRPLLTAPTYFPACSHGSTRADVWGRSCHVKMAGQDSACRRGAGVFDGTPRGPPGSAPPGSAAST